jgi:hypothetical protein
MWHIFRQTYHPVPCLEVLRKERKSSTRLENLRVEALTHEPPKCDVILLYLFNYALSFA